MTEEHKLVFVYATPIAMLALIFALFSSASPLKLGPSGILAAFSLMYLFCASVLFAVISFIVSVSKVFRPIGGLARRKAYYMASVVALAPILLLGLHTIGQLGIKDLLLVCILVSAICFYIFRRVH